MGFFFIEMENLSFNIPKKVLLILVALILIVAMSIRVITKDTEKGSDFLISAVTFVTQPIVNRMINRMETTEGWFIKHNK